MTSHADDRGGLRGLLERHGLHLSRDLGQNFLVDPHDAERLARLAGAGGPELVIEVGTGLGVLTRALAQRSARVRSVEIDSGLVRVLEQERLLPANVELIHGDARAVDWAGWLAEESGRVRVVANLPYSVATPLLRTLLDHRNRLVDWSVMVQREVADRLGAATGSRAYGSFSVLHRLTTDVETLATLGPERFFPRPKVESSFVRIWPRAEDPLGPGELERVERLTRAAFSQRRKQVANGLRRLAERLWPDDDAGPAAGRSSGGAREQLEVALRAVGLAPELRPERIEPEAWLALARHLPAAPLKHDVRRVDPPQ